MDNMNILSETNNLNWLVILEMSDYLDYIGYTFIFSSKLLYYPKDNTLRLNVRS